MKELPKVRPIPKLGPLPKMLKLSEMNLPPEAISEIHDIWPALRRTLSSYVGIKSFRLDSRQNRDSCG